MAKKNALGSDPFKWIKEHEEKEKTETEAKAETSKSDIDGQEKQTEKPPKPARAKKAKVIKIEEETYEPVYVPETPGQQESEVRGSSQAAEPGNVQEEKTVKTSDILEANRKAVLGADAYNNYHAKDSGAIQKDSPATAFVIVYTILLLILGFIVYRDLSKQIDKLETKLEVVEKKLDEGLINYEDTKVNDVW